MGMFDELLNEAADSGIMEQLEDALDTMAASAKRFAAQTADATSRDKLVRVWVNAQCVVVKVEIDEHLCADATPAELQQAMVEAAQAAALTMQQAASAFQQETWQQVARGLGTGPEPMADLGILDKLRPAVPLSPPSSTERRRPAKPLAVRDDYPEDPEEWQVRISD